MRNPRSAPLAIAFLCLAVTSIQAKQPNFVFFLVDNLGYMDLGANNADTFYETPNVDRLASEGMRFTNGYAANPVCSPTRYSIMAGKYPTRVDATNFFSMPRLTAGFWARVDFRLWRDSLSLLRKGVRDVATTGARIESPGTCFESSGSSVSEASAEDARSLPPRT